MSTKIILPEKFDEINHEINGLITDKKNRAKKTVNNAMLNLYWQIGQCLTEKVLKKKKQNMVND